MPPTHTSQALQVSFVVIAGLAALGACGGSHMGPVAAVDDSLDDIPSDGDTPPVLLQTTPLQEATWASTSFTFQFAGPLDPATANAETIAAVDSNGLALPLHVGPYPWWSNSIVVEIDQFVTLPTELTLTVGTGLTTDEGVPLTEPIVVSYDVDLERPMPALPDSTRGPLIVMGQVPTVMSWSDAAGSVTGTVVELRGDQPAWSTRTTWLSQAPLYDLTSASNVSWAAWITASGLHVWTSGGRSLPDNPAAAGATLPPILGFPPRASWGMATLIVGAGGAEDRATWFESDSGPWSTSRPPVFAETGTPITAIAADGGMSTVAFIQGGRVYARSWDVALGAWQPTSFGPLSSEGVEAEGPLGVTAGAVAWTEARRVVVKQLDGERLGPESVAVDHGANVDARVQSLLPGLRGLTLLYSATTASTWSDEAQSRLYIVWWDGLRWRHVGPPIDDRPGVSTPRGSANFANGGGLLLAWEVVDVATGDRSIATGRHSGAGAGPAGLTERPADPVGCDFPGEPDDLASGFPQTLAETGCYIDVPGRVLIDAAIPYDVKTPLYSDGAVKRRAIIVPSGASFTFSAVRSWQAPVGTVAIKEFLVPSVRGDKASPPVIVETRFLVHREQGVWGAYSYQWAPDGSGAVLRADEIGTHPWPIADEAGEPASHDHLYPSREACFQCHLADKEMLGLRTHQLNRPFRYPAGVANQLQTWRRLGLVTGVPDTEVGWMPNHEDTTVDLQPRVRAYLDANCAHCHPPHGTMRLRYEESLLQSGLCDRIAPGMLEQSTLWTRVALGEPTAMPEIGLLDPDPLFSDMLSEWILGMQTCP